jgi:hypothetical protein
MKKNEHKYKITLTLPFGPYESIPVAKVTQKAIRAKSKTPVKFSNIIKRGKGYVFDGVMSIRETTDGTNAQVKASVMSMFPTAKKVIVVNQTHKATRDSSWI